MVNLSFSNHSIVNSHLYTTDYYECFITNPNKILFISFNITQVVFVFPLCIAIIYLGLQQLQNNHFTSSAVKISHSDIITYHMVIIELFGVLGCIVSFTGGYMENLEVLVVGLNIFWFIWYGQTAFHTLTCLEHYLAVVHPMTYLNLKNGKGIRIRNISIGCVWLFSLFGVGVSTTDYYIYLDMCVLVLTIATISFFSISVLCVLNHPGPGEQGKERTYHSKHKACYTIVVILGILLLRTTVEIVWAFLDLAGNNIECIVMVGTFWVNLPSSLVLPLLYLQRAGKLDWSINILKCNTS